MMNILVALQSVSIIQFEQKEMVYGMKEKNGMIVGQIMIVMMEI